MRQKQWVQDFCSPADYRYIASRFIGDYVPYPVIYLLVLCWFIQPVYAVDPALQLVGAAGAGRLDTVQNLLNQGVDANSKNSGERTALMAAAANGNVRTVRALLASGADAGLQDARGRTALMEASAFGYFDVVTLLITVGVDVNAKDKAGNSALSMATKGKYQKVVELLGEAGATEGEAGEE